jgi:hypothetical protein
MNQHVAIPPSRTLAVATGDGIVVPRVIADAGDQAARRFLEFVAATVRNKNTRMRITMRFATFLAGATATALAAAPISTSARA